MGYFFFPYYKHILTCVHCPYFLTVADYIFCSILFLLLNVSCWSPHGIYKDSPHSSAKLHICYRVDVLQIFSNLLPTDWYLDCFQSFTIEKSLCFLVLLILLSIAWQVHLWHRFLEEDYWFRVYVYIILQHNS